MLVGFATDHGGYLLKEPILKALRDSGHKVQDFGAGTLDPGDDYPDFVIPLALAVAQGKWSAALRFAAVGWGPVSQPIK